MCIVPMTVFCSFGLVYLPVISFCRVRNGEELPDTVLRDVTTGME